LSAPLGAFLRTESGSAGVLLAATLAALVWANITPTLYEAVWQAPLAIKIGNADLSLTLRQWVNSGLMTFFLMVLPAAVASESVVGVFAHFREVTTETGLSH